MANKTQTQYEVGTKVDLTAIDQKNVTQLVYGGLMRARLLIRLEARMIAYDALHGTHYRKLRHQVVRRDRDAAFEASIGLIRTK